MNSTIEQLRRDIDSGKTADKVAVIDTAAAPLGADEEAAGTPLSGAAITRAHETELALGEKVNRKRARDEKRSYFEVAAIITAASLATYALIVWTR